MYTVNAWLLPRPPVASGPGGLPGALARPCAGV